MAGLLENTFADLDTTLADYFTDVVEAVITDITPVVSVLLTIYMMLWGWLVIRGQVNEFVTDGFTRIVRLTIIVAIALNVGHYNGFVSDLLFALPDHLLGVTSNGASTSTGEYLDSVFKQIWEAGWLFVDQAIEEENLLGMANIPLTLAGIAVWVLGVFLVFFASFLIILSKMALTVLIGVGPIFIILTMFEATKRFFDAWLGQCFNFILISLLVGGVLRLIISILVSHLVEYKDAAAPFPVIEDVVPITGFSLFGIFVLKQVLPMASALGGGIALSTLGVGRAIAGAAKSRLDRYDRNRSLQREKDGKSTTSGQQLNSGYQAAKGAAAKAALKLRGGNTISK